MQQHSPLKAGLSLAAALVLFAWPGGARAADQETGTDNEQVRRAVHVCVACHGEGGSGTDAAFPRLAGQPAAYTVAQLTAFRSEKRAEMDSRSYMWGVSALLDDAAIRDLAEYFAAQTPGAGTPGDPEQIQAGQLIFSKGIPARGVRPCAACHGEHAEGASVFPRLAGQHAAYVVRQLKGFETRLRPHGTIMANEVRQMTEGEMRSVAQYVQSR